MSAANERHRDRTSSFESPAYVRAFLRHRRIAASALRFWVDSVARLLPIVPSRADVLDACCGPGRLTIPIAEALGSSTRVFGVDRSRAMIAQCRELARSLPVRSVTACQCDILTYQHEPGFDVILVSEALHAFDELGPLLYKLRVLLRQGGSLIIRSPSHAQLKQIEWLQAFDGLLAHDCARTPDTAVIEKALTENGFVEIHSDAVDESTVYATKEDYVEPLIDRAYSILERLTNEELELGASQLASNMQDGSIRHTFGTTRTIARKDSKE